MKKNFPAECCSVSPHTRQFVTHIFRAFCWLSLFIPRFPFDSHFHQLIHFQLILFLCWHTVQSPNGNCLHFGDHKASHAKRSLSFENKLQSSHWYSVVVEICFVCNGRPQCYARKLVIGQAARRNQANRKAKRRARIIVYLVMFWPYSKASQPSQIRNVNSFTNLQNSDTDISNCIIRFA